MKRQQTAVIPVDRIIQNVDKNWSTHLKEVGSLGKAAQRDNLIGNTLGNLRINVNRGWLSERDARRVFDHVNRKLTQAGFEPADYNELMHPEGSRQERKL